MIRRLVCIAMGVLVLQCGFYKTAICGVTDEIESRAVEIDKIKAQIKGVITETSDNSFTIWNKKNAVSSVQYSQVQKVKAQQLSTKATIIIGIALIVGIIVAVAVSLPE
jgi:hypothetical protein